MKISAPLNLQKWIDDHRHLLKPPVANQVVWRDTDFIIMLVGGPNQRTDYHVNHTEEFFYQLEGDMVLRIMEAGAPRDIPIRAGDIFLLPPGVPHSPQRTANTVGLVVERKRPADMEDGFQWYCRACHQLLYEAHLHVFDIVKQLPEVFQNYYDNPASKICPHCHKEVSDAQH